MRPVTHDHVRCHGGMLLARATRALACYSAWGAGLLSWGPGVSTPSGPHHCWQRACWRRAEPWPPSPCPSPHTQVINYYAAKVVELQADRKAEEVARQIDGALKF